MIFEEGNQLTKKEEKTQNDVVFCFYQFKLNMLSMFQSQIQTIFKAFIYH